MRASPDSRDAVLARRSVEGREQREGQSLGSEGHVDDTDPIVLSIWCFWLLGNKGLNRNRHFAGASQTCPRKGSKMRPDLGCPVRFCDKYLRWKVAELASRL